MTFCLFRKSIVTVYANFLWNGLQLFNIFWLYTSLENAMFCLLLLQYCAESLNSEGVSFWARLRTPPKHSSQYERTYVFFLTMIANLPKASLLNLIKRIRPNFSFFLCVRSLIGDGKWIHQCESCEDNNYAVSSSISECTFKYFFFNSCSYFRKEHFLGDSYGLLSFVK